MRLFQRSLVLATSAIALSGCGLFQPPEHEAHLTLRVADAAMSSGAPDLALHVADMILQKTPGDAPATVARGDALYAMGRMEEARGAYRRAVTLAPDDAAAQIGLGRTLVRTDPKAAEAAFLAALAQQPDNVIALNNLGIARDMQGRHWDAQAAYREALSAAPDSSDVQTNLDLSLALSGQAAAGGPVAAAPGVARAASVPPAAAQPQAIAAASEPAPEADAPPVLAIDRAAVAAVRQHPLPAVAAAAPPPPPHPAADLSKATATLATPAHDVSATEAANPLDIGRDLTDIPFTNTGAGAALNTGVLAPAGGKPAAPQRAPGSVAAAIDAVLDPGRRAAPPVDSAVSPDLDPSVQRSAAPAAEQSTAPGAAPGAAAPSTDAAAARAPHAVSAARRPASRPVARGTGSGYVVQIGALDSDRTAKAEWHRLTNLMPDLFAGRTPVVQQADVKQRTFWRLRTGQFADAASAGGFCARLRAAGSGCWAAPAERD